MNKKIDIKVMRIFHIEIKHGTVMCTGLPKMAQEPNEDGVVSVAAKSGLG